MLRLFLSILFASASLSASADEALQGWGIFANPDGDCNISKLEGIVTVGVPGSPHDLSVELGRMNAPRVVQEVTGDFIVEVEVLGAPAPDESLIIERAAYQGSGLVLMKDESTYLRLERAAVAHPDEVVQFVNFELRHDKALHPAHAARLSKDMDLYLRLERRDGHVLGAVSPDRLHWTYLEPFKIDLGEKVSVGVAAINGSSRSFEARFKNFQLFQPRKSEPLSLGR